MPGLLLAPALILCIIRSVYASSYPIEPKDWAILKDKNHIYEKYDDIWIPGYNEAALALNAAFKYVAQSLNNHPEMNFILVNRGLFRVQFAGIINAGARKIFCNFFDRRMNVKQWKTEQVLTDDTDFYSWSMVYDPAKNSCGNFTISGHKTQD